MNSPLGSLNNDPFDILEDSKLTVSVCGILTRSMNSLELIGQCSNVTIEVNSPTSLTHMTDGH